jgi:hypothetical protein
MFMHVVDVNMASFDSGVEGGVLSRFENQVHRPSFSHNHPSPPPPIIFLHQLLFPGMFGLISFCLCVSDTTNTNRLYLIGHTFTDLLSSRSLL